MTFSVACECGKNHTVSEGSAGSRFHCECGLTVNVPSLVRLRDMAGLAPIEIPLEFEIPELLESGVIPKSECADCGRTPAELVHFVADCEQLHTKSSGGFSWGMFLITGGRLFLWEDEVVEFHGRDTTIRIPACLCVQCHRKLRSLRPRSAADGLGGFLIIGGFFSFLLIHWSMSLTISVVGVVTKLYANNTAERFQQRLRMIVESEPVYRKIFHKFPDARILIER